MATQKKSAWSKLLESGSRKRKVTLDSSVLISYVISKRDDSVVKKVVTKSTRDDRLMLTDVIMDECVKYTEGRKARASKEEMTTKLKELSPRIIKISPVPPESELLKKYNIRDKTDLPILYSVETTKSVIFVTLDDDFTDVKGLKAKIMRPGEYLYDDKGKKNRLKKGGP